MSTVSTGLRLVAAGDYIIKGNNLGDQPVFSSVFKWNNIDIQIPDLKFNKTKGVQLGGIEVVYRKPLVETNADKTIVHVEGTVNAIGQDAIELLRKSPGVMVDKDDNIVFSGKTGSANIYRWAGHAFDWKRLIGLPEDYSIKSNRTDRIDQ
jgi:hypothetical protein